MLLRRRLSRALVQAVRQSDLSLRQKLLVRMALALPTFREAILEHLEEVVGPNAAAIGDGELIKIIIENLDVILEFILALLGALG